jgi:hypothetical protein
MHWIVDPCDADPNDHFECFIALLELRDMCPVFLTQVVPFVRGELGEAGGVSIGKVFDVVKLQLEFRIEGVQIYLGVLLVVAGGLWCAGQESFLPALKLEELKCWLCDLSFSGSCLSMGGLSALSLLIFSLPICLAMVSKASFSCWNLVAEMRDDIVDSG